MPDINRTIDFLHALWNQYGDKVVTIDGDEEEIADICFAAVTLIERNWEYKGAHPMRLSVCDCYTSDGRCMGTREIDFVSCCGDKNKCIYK